VFRGEVLVVDGRAHIVVGVDPFSVTPRRIYLQDLETGEDWTADLDDVAARSVRQPLRLIRRPDGAPDDAP
jgi:hypothetical protein